MDRIHFPAAGAPPLRASQDPGVAVAYLRALEADDHDALGWRQMLVPMVERMAGLARRDHPGSHLTAGAVVVDPGRWQALAVWHPRFDRWLQLGGHCDGDTNLAGVALREATEESGLADLRVDPVPFHLGVHPVDPLGDPHVHFDTRFVVFARPGASEHAPASPEGLTLRWFGPADVDEAGPEVAALLRAGIGRARARLAG